MRLLVGMDKRDGGKDALELARVLGASGGASVLVVTVLFGGLLPVEYALLPDEEAREAEPLLREARETLADMEIETRAYGGGGSPAGILTTLAEREDFDAIVVGSPHRGAFGRVVLGSVAKSLLNGAPADVAVAPKGFAQMSHGSPRDIAVGYDGTPESKVALRRAEALAKDFNARIKVLTVAKPPAAVPVMVPAYQPEFPPEPDKVVNEGINSIDSSLAAEGTRLDGDPATELARKCEEGVDLLILGSRGYGPMARALLGSVSRQLMPKAPCPVLVVCRP